jgi:hypothetical protein
MLPILDILQTRRGNLTVNARQCRESRGPWLLERGPCTENRSHHSLITVSVGSLVPGMQISTREIGLRGQVANLEATYVQFAKACHVITNI